MMHIFMMGETPPSFKNKYEDVFMQFKCVGWWPDDDVDVSVFNSHN